MSDTKILVSNVEQQTIHVLYISYYILRKAFMKKVQLLLSKAFSTAWTVERVLRARSTVPKGSIKYSAASSIQYSATSTGLWAHKSAASTGL